MHPYGHKSGFNASYLQESIAGQLTLLLPLRNNKRSVISQNLTCQLLIKGQFFTKQINYFQVPCVAVSQFLLIV